MSANRPKNEVNNRKYYYLKEEIPIGPHSFEELLDKIKPYTLVAYEDGTEWKSANNFPELNEYFSSSINISDLNIENKAEEFGETTNQSSKRGKLKKTKRQYHLFVFLSCCFLILIGYIINNRYQNGDYFVHSYYGFLNGEQVKMTLVRQKFYLSGSYTIENSNSTVFFNGSIDKDNNIILLEKGKNKGKIKGAFLSRKTISGEWSHLNGKKAMSFYLTLLNAE